MLVRASSEALGKFWSAMLVQTNWNWTLVDR